VALNLIVAHAALSLDCALVLVDGKQRNVCGRAKRVMQREPLRLRR